MYILPLIAILLVALAIFFSPIFAVILFVFFLLGLGFYKFLGQGTEPESTSTTNMPGAATTPTRSAEDEDTGPWGETWPEQREGAQ